MGLLLGLLTGVIRSQHADCHTDNHDCSCSDISYGECNPAPPTVDMHVTNLEECILNCDLFHTFGQCDWLLFDSSGTKENCQLFSLTSQGETMEQYLGTCNVVGQPTRRQDGACMTDNPLICTGPGKPIFCPQGCNGCDLTDPCNINYHQTKCSIIDEGTGAVEVTPDEETCLAACIGQSNDALITYMSFHKIEETCTCHNGGTRNCGIEVVKYGFTLADVENCKIG